MMKTIEYDHRIFLLSIEVLSFLYFINVLIYLYHNNLQTFLIFIRKSWYPAKKAPQHHASQHLC